MVNISQSYFLVQTVLFKINVWVFVCLGFFTFANSVKCPILPNYIK